MFIADKEKIQLQKEAAQLIANLSDGAMRDALSILDSCISLSSGEITLEVVRSTTLISDTKSIIDLTNYISDKNLQGIFQIIDIVTNQSMDPLRFCQQIINHFKNIMILKQTGKQDYLTQVLENEIKEIEIQAEKFSLDEILHIISQLSICSNNMTKSLNKKLELETCLVKIVSCEGFNFNNEKEHQDISTLHQTIELLLNKIKILEKKTNQVTDEINKIKNSVYISSLHISNDSKKTALNTAINSQIMDKSCGSEINNIGQENIEDIYNGVQQLAGWGNILESLLKINPALGAALERSKGYVNDKSGIILIEADSELFLNIIRTSEHAKKTLKEAIYRELGKKYRIGPYKKDDNIGKLAKNDDILAEIEKSALDIGITPSITT